ncbi:MAG: hypothetical protein PHS57_04360 [Alphaproteobacteria bacterium]|nr:hypothetical protein [Alphaproteobacteria bacterium]
MLPATSSTTEENNGGFLHAVEARLAKPVLEFLGGAATSFMIRLAFKMATVDLLGSTAAAPVAGLGIAMGAGAVAGGVVGVLREGWRRDEGLMASVRAEGLVASLRAGGSLGKGSWARRAFVRGAAFGTLGGVVGMAFASWLDGMMAVEGSAMVAGSNPTENIKASFTSGVPPEAVMKATTEIGATETLITEAAFNPVDAINAKDIWIPGRGWSSAQEIANHPEKLDGVNPALMDASRFWKKIGLPTEYGKSSWNIFQTILVYCRHAYDEGGFTGRLNGFFFEHGRANILSAQAMDDLRLAALDVNSDPSSPVSIRFYGQNSVEIQPRLTL